MYARRRKKKVLAQLEALIRKKAQQAATEQPALPQPQQQPTTPSPTTPPAQRANVNSAAGASSIFQALKSVNTPAPQQTATWNRPQEAAATTPQAAELPPIDPMRLNGAWHRFCEQLPQSEMYLKAIMNQTPKCHGNVVTATITDPSQATICKREDLIAFIRNELGRPDITLETELDAKAQEAGSAPFTSIEKLHVMVDENKNLQKLIEKFGLQLD